MFSNVKSQMSGWLPSMPAMPAMPAMPSMPAIPTMTMPSMPNVQIPNIPGLKKNSTSEADSAVDALAENVAATGAVGGGDDDEDRSRYIR